MLLARNWGTFLIHEGFCCRLFDNQSKPILKLDMFRSAGLKINLIKIRRLLTSAGFPIASVCSAGSNLWDFCAFLRRRNLIRGKLCKWQVYTLAEVTAFLPGNMMPVVNHCGVSSCRHYCTYTSTELSVNWRELLNRRNLYLSAPAVLQFFAKSPKSSVVISMAGSGVSGIGPHP